MNTKPPGTSGPTSPKLVAVNSIFNKPSNNQSLSSVAEPEPTNLKIFASSTTPNKTEGQSSSLKKEQRSSVSVAAGNPQI